MYTAKVQNIFEKKKKTDHVKKFYYGYTNKSDMLNIGFHEKMCIYNKLKKYIKYAYVWKKILPCVSTQRYLD